MIDHHLNPWHARIFASALAVVLSAAVVAALSALVGCATITWDAGAGTAHVTCRDTESVVTLPGGQVLTITHERGRGLCDAVEAMRPGARP